MFDTLTLLSGYDKEGNKELLNKVEFKFGSVYTIIGRTGSGKTQLINDIESMVKGDSITNRSILLNNKKIENETSFNNKFVAHLSQNMNYALDLTVEEFLNLRIKCSNLNVSIKEIINKANIITGEKIEKKHILNKLSGGQSRALMIADIAVNNSSPIILIDEIENAGINKLAAINELMKSNKLIVIVTHDPLLALMGEKRIIMKNGAMYKLISRTKEEEILISKLHKLSIFNENLRLNLREGLNLKEDIIYDFKSILE
ncbi:TPA: ATP-binding cassette domain-containing protein [Clostridium sporogenes]